MMEIYFLVQHLIYIISLQLMKDEIPFNKMKLAEFFATTKWIGEKKMEKAKEMENLKKELREISIGLGIVNKNGIYDFDREAREKEREDILREDLVGRMAREQLYKRVAEKRKFYPKLKNVMDEMKSMK